MQLHHSWSPEILAITWKSPLMHYPGKIPLKIMSHCFFFVRYICVNHIIRQRHILEFSFPLLRPKPALPSSRCRLNKRFSDDMSFFASQSSTSIFNEERFRASNIKLVIAFPSCEFLPFQKHFFSLEWRQIIQQSRACFLETILLLNVVLNRGSVKLGSAQTF